MSKNEKMSDAVVALHNKRRLVVDFDVKAGHLIWTATLSGEDFLDGPWEMSREGISKSMPAVLRALKKGFAREQER